MFKNNLPRYWVGWYDRWHLLLALLLILLVCLFGYLVSRPVSAPTLGAANSGAVPHAGEALELTGTASPNSVLTLWDGDQRLQDTRADASGTYRFVVPNIAEGAHTFRTVVQAGSDNVASDVLNLTASAPVSALRPTTAAAALTATPVRPSATPIPPSVTPSPATATALPATMTATKNPPTPTAVPSTPTPAPATVPAAGAVQRRGKDDAEMVLVTAGEFTAGDAITRTVYLDAYWLDRTEVTNAQLKQFVDATGYKTEAEITGSGYDYINDKWELVSGLTWLTLHSSGSSIAGQPKNPVVFVSWNDARAYCTWAGKRLPTEAEWEKAARGLDGRIFPWGNLWDATKTNACDSSCAFAWKEAGGNDGYAESAPVGSFAQGASPYGALDMAGNVWEWVADWFGPDYPNGGAARNPTGPATADAKVLRGGAWSIGQSFARTTSRFSNLPTFRERSVGLRCAQ